MWYHLSCIPTTMLMDWYRRQLSRFDVVPRSHRHQTEPGLERYVATTHGCLSTPEEPGTSPSVAIQDSFLATNRGRLFTVTRCTSLEQPSHNAPNEGQNCSGSQLLVVVISSIPTTHRRASVSATRRCIEQPSDNANQRSNRPCQDMTRRRGLGRALNDSKATEL
jgi:hypothetical protein